MLPQLHGDRMGPREISRTEFVGGFENVLCGVGRRRAGRRHGAGCRVHVAISTQGGAGPRNGLLGGRREGQVVVSSSRIRSSTARRGAGTVGPP